MAYLRRWRCCRCGLLERSDYIPSPTGTDSGPGGRAVSDADFRDQAMPDGGRGRSGRGPGRRRRRARAHAPSPSPCSRRRRRPWPRRRSSSPRPWRCGSSRRPARRATPSTTSASRCCGCPRRPRPPSGKLNQVGLDALPESNVVVYRFADTPIDVASAESGNYELLVIARTKGGVEGRATRAVPDRRRPQHPRGHAGGRQVLPGLGARSTSPSATTSSGRSATCR